jgi:hypothetical protein
MSAADKAAGPVTPQELEGLSLRVAQARSTLNLLASSHGADADADLQNALGLLVLHLDQCAEDLSELHRRQEDQGEARP